jgi:hypothetical protein
MGGGAILLILIRVIGTIVCSNRAKELNRSSSGWGTFGLVLPVIAMIWIYCLKPVIIWEKNESIDNNKID